MYCPLHRGYSTYLIIIERLYSCQGLLTFAENVCRSVNIGINNSNYLKIK